MTTQLIYSQRNEVNDQTKTQSRIVSLKSAIKDLSKSIDDFNRDTSNLSVTLDNITRILQSCTNQIRTIQWAAQELCAFLKELYEIPKVEKKAHTVGSTGKRYETVITYPHLGTYNSIKAKYKQRLGL